MEKSRKYPRTWWEVASINALIRAIKELKGTEPKGGTVVRGHDTWTYDTLDEWLADYSTMPDGASLSCFPTTAGRPYFRFNWTRVPGAWSDKAGSTLDVIASDKSTIEQVFLAFESGCRPRTVPLTVFIGHGRSGTWRELADILEKRFDIETVTFDYDERTGFDIRGTLMGLLDQATFAILILTAEDEMVTGDVRARQNVVHEVGLFQGRLGFDRAIVLIEDGCSTFTNMAGTLHIEFPRSAVEQAVGRVVATLRREFGPI